MTLPDKCEDRRLVGSGPGAPGALEGVRICDLSGILAGAGATRFLAALGAEVIRVEDPVRQGRWDMLRRTGPYVSDRRGINDGTNFNNHNVGKLGVTLDLKHEEGRNLLWHLIDVSDVVTENFSGGTFARLGFSYDEMRARKPSIVYVSNSGFGHTGPYAGYRSYGPIVQAVSGLTFMAGLPDLPPAGWGYSYMDHVGADVMVVAVLAALLHRDVTGDGAWIDMSCAEAAMAFVGPSILDYTVNGRPSRREGMPSSNRSEHPAMAPHGIYPGQIRDDWIAIACRHDDDWMHARAVIGEPWALTDRYAAVEGRISAQDELDSLLSQWTRQRSARETQDLLRGASVPASIVARPADRVEDHDQWDDWRLWTEVVHPDIGRIRVDGLPMHFSKTDWRVESPAPQLGQHNAQVFMGILGLSQERFAELQRAGVI